MKKFNAIVARRAKVAGLKPATVKWRMREKGMSLNEAILAGQPFDMRRGRKLTPESVAKRERTRASRNKKKLGRDSISVLAAQHNLKRATVYRRMHIRGMSLEDALAMPTMSRAEAARLIPVNPNSLSAKARAAGLKPATVFRRVKYKKWSLEKALTTPLLNTGNLPDPASLSGLARQAGLKPSTVHLRVNVMGWSLEKALSTPLQSQEGDEITRKSHELGLNPCTIRRRVNHGVPLELAVRTVPNVVPALAHEAGLDPRLVRERQAARGWDLTRALTTPRMSHSEAAKSNIHPNSISARAQKAGCDPRLVLARIQRGETFEEATSRPAQVGNIAPLARAVGKHASTVRLRMKKGWSLERALNTPLISPSERQLLGVKARSNVRGINISEEARKAGLAPATVAQRIYHGWSKERALSTPVSDGPSLEEQARTAGLPFSTVKTRIYKLGWSEELALSTPRREKAQNAATLAERSQRTLVRRRMKAGWSKEKALTTPALSPKDASRLGHAARWSHHAPQT